MLDTRQELSPTGRTALTESVSQALGLALRAADEDLPSPRKAETFTCEKREEVYKVLGLSPSQIKSIEQIVLEAPARLPGKRALNNVISRIPSKKNGGLRWVESHTVERLFLYQLERDPECVGYVTQARCRGVTRMVRKGRHVTAPILDFLVFYRERIVVVECKTEETLEKLTIKKDEWRCEDGRWTNEPYETCVKRLGMEFEVFVGSRLFATELQNAEFIYGEINNQEAAEAKQLRHAAAEVLKERPLTIEQMGVRLPGFSIRTAARMLAERMAFGLERIISLGDSDQFLLFSGIEHRDIVDEGLWQGLLGETDELGITDRLLLAAPSTVAFAKRRWSRLRAIAGGEQPRTRRMDLLAKKVSEAISRGLSPIEACLSDHPNCGGTATRLDVHQEDAVKNIVGRWNKGEFCDRTAAYIELGKLCEKSGALLPHQSTLNRKLRELDQTRRTLSTEGIRQYQKDRARTDGTKCSQPSLAFGHTLIVDSSNFDQRIAKNLLTYFPSAVPRFYAGIDGATAYPMAHALIFGPARTDGLAILMREFVYRHGFLPRCIQLDRGSENRGEWVKDFAEHFYIELRWVPTGGSRYNGTAENVIGRINHFVAHPEPGSTLPDQKGRSADGRMKSRMTATKTFLIST